MSTNKTEHLQLHQWEGTDKFLREEFNENFQALDAETADIRSGMIVTGTYTGDGAVSRTISLGFAPRAVLVMSVNGYAAYKSSPYTYCYGGLALAGAPVAMNGYTAVELTVDGFRVFSREPNDNTRLRANETGENYHYLALR